MKIYIDEIFAINFLSNELLIYSYCIVFSRKAKHIRILIASMAAGMYSAFESAFGLPCILRAVMLAILMYISFGGDKLISNTTKMMIICMGIEGITLVMVMAFGGNGILTQKGITLFVSEPICAIIYILSYPVLIIIKKLRDDRDKYMKLLISNNDLTTEFYVLRDSGNLLKHHDKPVIMVVWDKVCNMFEYENYRDFKRNWESYVIYETISGAGVLPIFLPEHCFLNGCEIEAEIAVVERKFKGKYWGIAAEIIK